MMHVSILKVFLVLVSCAVILSGCGAGSGEGLDQDGNPIGANNSIPLADNLASIQANIFTPSCALSGCHSGASPQAGLLLTSANSFASLVNVPSTQVSLLMLVKPGDALNSYLVQKVEGTASFGVQMPRLMPPLSAQKIQVLRSWIDKGALGPTLSSIQQNIFTPRCTQCHFGLNPAASLNLEPGQSWANLVGIMRPFDPEIRVVAGDAGNSFLIDKLEGNNLGGSRGDRMPLSGPYLDQDTINVIRAWIDQGAQDN